MASKEGYAVVEMLKQKWGYDVVEVTGGVRTKKFGKRYVQTADAFRFISLIKDAEFVVTSSFHGTAFSIIFEKQFYAIGFGQRVGRVKSLLSLLHIEERLIYDVDSLPDKEIEYIMVSKAMSEILLVSKNYIENNIR